MKAGRKLGLQAAYAIKGKEFIRKEMSNTFHGRDIFAKTAGLIASGRKPREVGPQVKIMAELSVPSPETVRNGFRCLVLNVDRFGNVITNLPSERLARLGKAAELLKISCKKGSFTGRVSHGYQEVATGGLAVMRGSQGYVELAVREGSAAELLRLKPMGELEIRRVR